MTEQEAVEQCANADPGNLQNAELRRHGLERIAARASHLLDSVSRYEPNASQWQLALEGLEDPTKVLSDPYFRFWLLRMMAHERKQQSAPAFASLLPNLMLPYLLRGNDAAALSKLAYVTDADGRIFGCGFSIRSGWVNTQCSLQLVGGQLLGRDLRSGGSRTNEIQALPVTWDLRMGANSYVSCDHPWLHERMAQLNAQDVQEPNPRHDIGLPYINLHQICAIHEEALMQVKRAWPELASEIEMDVRVICPFSGAALNGWADVYLMGAIFVREEAVDVAFVLERLVHQAAHVRLFLITHAPLHEHPNSHLVQSPIRRDLRPINGLFHAAFVCSRLIALFSRIGTSEYMRRRLELIPQFQAAIRTLRSVGRLTYHGETLIQSMCGLAGAE